MCDAELITECCDLDDGVGLTMSLLCELFDAELLLGKNEYPGIDSEDGSD